MLEMANLILSLEADRRYINKNRTLDTPGTRLRHATPILERVRDQSVCGNRRNGLVKVLHLDRM